MPKPYIFSAEYSAENFVPVPEEELALPKNEGSESHQGIHTEQARHLMEKTEKGRFFGPEEVKRVFGIDLIEFPPIPFSQEELEQAEKLGQQLVLYADKAPDGSPLTIAKMNEMMAGKTSAGEKLLRGTKVDSNGQPLGELKADTWYQEKFFTEQTPVLSWRLTGKTELTDPADPALESKSKNYLEQTEVIIKYLKEKVFNSVQMPPQFQTAIEEFEREKPTIAGLMDSDWQKADARLEQLLITRLTREIPAETIYRYILTERETTEKLLTRQYVWTAMRSSGGDFVYVGNAVADGVDVFGDQPGGRDSYLGASLSRSV